MVTRISYAIASLACCCAVGLYFVYGDASFNAVLVQDEPFLAELLSAGSWRTFFLLFAAVAIVTAVRATLQFPFAWLTALLAPAWLGPCAFALSSVATWSPGHSIAVAMGVASVTTLVAAVIELTNRSSRTAARAG